jgi:hypothetical protein
VFNVVNRDFDPVVHQALNAGCTEGRPCGTLAQGPRSANRNTVCRRGSSDRRADGLRGHGLMRRVLVDGGGAGPGAPVAACAGRAW